MIKLHDEAAEHEGSTTILLPLLEEHQKMGLVVLPNPHSKSSHESLLELLAQPIRQYIVNYCDGCRKDKLHPEWTKDWC
jgi:hypothetical protein